MTTTDNRAIRRARHRAPGHRGPLARGFAATMITAATISTAGVGIAVAAPGDQPGVTDGPGSNPDQPGVTDGPGSNPDQPGVTDTPPTTPAPAPAPEPAPGPVVSGPSFVPDPTYDAPPVYYDTSPGTDYQGPSYSGDYNPVPPVLYAPRPVAPQRPQVPAPLPEEKFIYFSPTTKIDKGPLSNADVRNINGQIGTGRARIATFYQSIGFPEDQAARTAASTTVGALTGGVIGAGTVGVPAAVVGGVVGAGVGAAAGAIIGGVISGGVLAGPGALIGLGVGAGVGAAGAGAAGATIGAVGGGLIGGAVGTVVGAGDPGGNPNAPTGPTNEDPRLSSPPPPNPDAPQFEAHLDRTGLPGGGRVDYVVSKSGDVSGQVNLGPVTAPIAITAAQADAPYQAAGVFAQTARDTVARGVADISAQAQKAMPGLRVTFPQLSAPAAAKPVRR